MAQRVEFTPIASLAEQLIHAMTAYRSCAVAFSGGVDSAVVAAAAYRALGDRAVAWTGIGPAVPQSDRDDAIRVAQSIGIRHEQVATSEISNPNYVNNGPDRCYHCKSTLFATMRTWGDRHGFDVIASGTNFDDLADYRPGLKAGQEWRVVTPLADLKIGKAAVRAIAQHWGLSVAEKLASPCLASRIAYGQVVTIGKLASIEAIERWLRENGFVDSRARVHAEGLLRIELPASDWGRLLDENHREACVELARSHGFHFVTLDIAGRASGSLNRTLDPQTTQKSGN